MFLVQIAWAQYGRRCLTTLPVSSTIALRDSLLIDPQSIELTPNLAFEYDQSTKEISLKVPIATSIEVCYRVFPINVEKVYAHQSADAYDSTATFSAFTQEVYQYEKEELFETPKIYKTGSLTRGVSFGNSQSVNVNSSFNFQMEGQLTDKLNIRADITDQNVPFQPEGNTQQLREFDNVTFEVYNDDLSIQAGDVLLKNDNSYFLKYNKNVLGGKIDVKYGDQNKTYGQSMFAIAAAKGQFVDLTLDAEEGLQGPYQLRDANGRQFLVVMANSEQVYIDGQLMTRGFNYDYVIDYNLGEITFTPNVLITQFTRIRVTFEYSDQSYSRSIITARQKVNSGKVDFTFNYYREKDDLNRPLAFTLSQEDQIKMAEAGDDDIPVPIGSELQVPYLADRVLYEKIDTVDLDNNPVEIFQYSRDSIAELYQVSFAEVGFGNGDYELVQNDVNGRVYEWVSPQLGQSMGRYAPVRFVPAPNMRQMVTVEAKLRIGKSLEAYSEVAFSNEDLNLYSPIGNEDNRDLATLIGARIVKKPLSKGYFLSADINYEYDGKDFQIIDRYRPIEYDRNWSYRAKEDTFRTSDNIFNIVASIKKDLYNQINARYSTRQKEFAIDGYQQDYSLQKSFDAIKFSGAWFDMNNDNLYQESSWQRWHGEVFYDRFFAVPGYKIMADQNEVKATGTDSLVSTAMNYTSQQFYIRNHDSLRMSFRLEQIFREDKSITEGNLLPFTQSQTTTAQVSTPKRASQVVELTATYRQLQYLEEFSELDDENLILGRVNWRSVYFKRHLDTDLMYSTSSSREILREFAYVQVPTGEGTHTWRDLNEDGVQDISEFFLAVNFDEKNYIRVFVPTTESVDAFNTLFIYTLNANAPRSWSKADGFLGFLGKWSNRTNININKKNTDDDFNSRFNPFALQIDDQNLIFTRDGIRSTMFYNRTGRGLGGDITYLVNRSKQAISRGVDSRSTQEYSTNLRYHIGDEITLTTGYMIQYKKNASQYQQDQNFEIQTNRIAPGIIWQPNNNLRFSTVYSLIQKINTDAEVPEESQTDEVTFETRWANGIKNSLTANFTYSNISFEGDENTAAAYELLNALRPGVNTAWRLNYNQKLFSGLQMTLGYEGRKSSGSNMIHMGRMQVTALF